MKKKYYPLLFLCPSLVGCSLFAFIPYLDVIRRSFANKQGGCGIQNYTQVLQNEAFLIASKNTFFFMAICIPLLMALSLVIAVLIYEDPKSRTFIRTGLLLPMAVPVASVVLVWKVTFLYNGIINGFFYNVGLKPQNWMESDMAVLILVISYIWKNLGYNVILWIAALSAIKHDTIEAATVDGASTLQIYMHIVLPQLRKQMCCIFILAIINSFKVFREVYLVSGDYPNDRIYLIQHLFNNWFRNLELDKIAAASVLDSIVLITFILLLQCIWEGEE